VETPPHIPASPDHLDEGLSLRGRIIGVTRLNKKAALVLLGVLAVLAGIVVYSVLQRGQRTQSMPADPSSPHADTHAARMTKRVPWYASEPDAVPALRPASNGAGGSQAASDRSARSHAMRDPPRPSANNGSESRDAPASPLRESRRRREERQIQAQEQAVIAPLAVSGFQTPSASLQANQDHDVDHSTANSLAIPGLPEIASALLNTGQSADPNRQGRKETFLRDAAKASANEADYLPAVRQPPITPYELKAGTVIPAVLISGINSDLPGEVTAQVRENVYDTASGRHLLVPQGSRLVGTYDSQVAYGQRRVLVAWQRLLFPDGSSLNLQGAPGADAGGYAGFNDRVNNHYGRIFGGAILMSLLGAGAQLSQPQQGAREGSAPDASQIIAAQLGQQMSEAGRELVRKGLNVQPTLEIRPGYAFNVMVVKDVVLERPYARP